MNPRWTPLQRRTWLAHERKRKPAPVLRPVYPDLLQWEWNRPDPYRWNVWTSLNGGASFFLISDYWMNGGDRQFAPDGGSEFYYVVGVDAAGNEITRHSNVVRPDDAPAPPDLTPELVAHFDFDETSGNFVSDGTPYELAVVDGTVTAVGGLFSNAAGFDGSGAYLAGTEDTDAFVAGTFGLTISVWVNFDYMSDSSRTCYIASVWQDSAWPTGSAWHIYAQPADGFVGAEMIGTGMASIGGYGTISSWTHFCLVFDPVAVLWTLYLNGAMISTVNFNAAAVVGRLGVGAHTYPSTPPPDYLVDELSIWTRKLSPTEVGRLYNLGNGLPYAEYTP